MFQIVHPVRLLRFCSNACLKTFRSFDKIKRSLIPPFERNAERIDMRTLSTAPSSVNGSNDPHRLVGQHFCPLLCFDQVRRQTCFACFKDCAVPQIPSWLVTLFLHIVLRDYSCDRAANRGPRLRLLFYLVPRPQVRNPIWCRNKSSFRYTNNPCALSCPPPF